MYGWMNRCSAQFLGTIYMSYAVDHRRRDLTVDSYKLNRFF